MKIRTIVSMIYILLAAIMIQSCAVKKNVNVKETRDSVSTVIDKRVDIITKDSVDQQQETAISIVDTSRYCVVHINDITNYGPDGKTVVSRDQSKTVKIYANGSTQTRKSSAKNVVVAKSDSIVDIHGDHKRVANTKDSTNIDQRTGPTRTGSIHNSPFWFLWLLIVAILIVLYFVISRWLRRNNMCL